jgi:DNA-binding CsgD family transcriptional regulator
MASMTYERAIYHAQRLGAQFQQDMWDKRITCRELAARYDLDRTTAWDIRRVLVPLPHRVARIVVTDELAAIFATNRTTRSIAREMRMSYATALRLRRQTIGLERMRTVRYENRKTPKPPRAVNPKLPTNPGWYLGRTVAQAARELGLPYWTVSHHVKRFGIEHRRYR